MNTLNVLFSDLASSHQGHMHVEMFWGVGGVIMELINVSIRGSITEERNAESELSQQDYPLM